MLLFLSVSFVCRGEAGYLRVEFGANTCGESTSMHAHSCPQLQLGGRIAACQQAAVAYLNSALSLFDCALCRSGQCRRFHHGLKSNNINISPQLITPPPSLSMIFRRAAVFSCCSHCLLLLREVAVRDRCRCIGSTPIWRRKSICSDVAFAFPHHHDQTRSKKQFPFGSSSLPSRCASAGQRRRFAIAPDPYACICMLTIRTKAVTCRNNE